MPKIKFQWENLDFIPPMNKFAEFYDFTFVLLGLKSICPLSTHWKIIQPTAYISDT